MEFKEKVKLIRHWLRLSQAEFAASIGKTQTAISKIERGETESGHNSTIKDMIDVFNLNPEWLLNDKPSDEEAVNNRDLIFKNNGKVNYSSKGSVIIDEQKAYQNEDNNSKNKIISLLEERVEELKEMLKEAKEEIKFLKSKLGSQQ